MRTRNPIKRERTRRESAAVLKLVANPKRIASAGGWTTRYAEMLVAGDRDNLLGRTGDFFEALATERGDVYRAHEYLLMRTEEGEMSTRDVAPGEAYQEALRDLHDQLSSVLPLLLAEIRGESDPVATEDAALDVAGAARKLAIRARQLRAARRKERKAA